MSDEKWQMRFTADKCKTMHLGYHNKKYDYKMTSAEGEVTLYQTIVEKDLGVYVDDQLLFKEHTQKAASKQQRQQNCGNDEKVIRLP